MSEVNGPKISVNQVNYSGIQKVNPEITQEVVAETTPQITDFSDNTAETIGRSMLFKGKDSINNDLKVLLEHPQVAENSDEIFEAAYSAALEAGLENPYEEAASASTISM